MSRLSKKIAMKKSNAAKEGIGFSLSTSQIQNLLDEAGISESEWRHDGYHLARFNDTGDYAQGNCRFIPARENYAERVVSDRQKEASRRNIIATIANRSPEERSRISREAGLAYGRIHGLTARQIEDIYLRVNHIPKNSHFATRAAAILGCTSTHVRRLRKRWESLGFAS